MPQGTWPVYTCEIMGPLYEGSNIVETPLSDTIYK